MAVVRSRMLIHQKRSIRAARAGRIRIDVERSHSPVNPEDTFRKRLLCPRRSPPRAGEPRHLFAPGTDQFQSTNADAQIRTHRISFTITNHSAIGKGGNTKLGADRARPARPLAGRNASTRTYVPTAASVREMPLGGFREMSRGGRAAGSPGTGAPLDSGIGAYPRRRPGFIQFNGSRARRGGGSPISGSSRRPWPDRAGGGSSARRCRSSPARRHGGGRTRVPPDPGPPGP